MTNAHHVVPDGDAWAVKKAGDDTVIARFDLKEKAVHYGRQVSRREKTELVIHNQDGTIAQKDSHGNDPVSSPG